MRSGKPQILLVGVGKFGEKHLSTLLKLESEGILKVAGAVVKTSTSQKKLQEIYNFPIYTSLSVEIIKKVDGIDIVTPPETHFELIKQYLPLTNILVEKPLTINPEESKLLEEESKKTDNILMVGHIYRFHPVITKLKKVLKITSGKVISIKGSLLNPTSTDDNRDIELEFLHLFDITDYLFKQSIATKKVEQNGRAKKITLGYKNGLTGQFHIGWSGLEKIRTFDVIFADKKISCNLTTNIITITDKRKQAQEIIVTIKKTPLEIEISKFLQAIQNKKTKYPNATTGSRIVEIATRK